MQQVLINGQEIRFGENEKTILEVARSAEIYIPTLCDHEELEAYGGCRMCLVEVEGMRGYVPACATAVKDGMVIKTNTEKLIELKRRILQLLLMEHPNACLICDIQNECLKFRPQSQKSGRVTGCYTCPKRANCELASVVKYLGINDLDYKPEYKEIEVERSDPFFERDYNLCILCARCVRVCQDVRGTGAITLVKRGYEARINTSFGVSLLESGCWFCGACIDVCPTGAINSKKTKWTGTPELKATTTCVLCGMGCQVELDVKFKKILGSYPLDLQSPPNYHHLCVLGRFCIPSLVNAPDRLKYPTIIKDGSRRIVEWGEAVGKAVQLLRKTSVSKIAFIGSPHLSSESAYLFQKLARVAIGTSNVDFRGAEFPTLIHKALAINTDFSRIQVIDRLNDVDWILSVGSDFVKTQQVIAKSVNIALSKGCKLFTIGKAGLNQQRWSSEYIPIEPEAFPIVLSKLADHDLNIPTIANYQAERLVSTLSHGTGAILLGSRILESSDPNGCFRALLRLLGENGLIFPLYDLGNEAGVIKAGLCCELLPGPTSITESIQKNFENEWDKKITKGYNLKEMREKAIKGELDLIYITDGSVPVQGFEGVPNIIYQSPYPSQWMDLASIILPSASFVEEDGTIINQEYRTLKLKQIVPPPGRAKQDWSIFLEVANALGADGFSYENLDEIWNELNGYPRRIESESQTMKTSWVPLAKKEHEWYPKYRGSILAERNTDLDLFIKFLPKRERNASTETQEDLMTRLKSGPGERRKTR